MKNINKVDDSLGLDLLGNGIVFASDLSENAKIYTTNKSISDFAHIGMKAINQLIDKYDNELNAKEISPFEMDELNSHKVGRPNRIIGLNEEDAIFIISLLKNTKQVVKFKRALSKAFTSIKKELLKRQIIHVQSKPITKSLGDAIKDNSNMNGSHDYLNLNKLIYKTALGIDTSNLRRQRNIPKNNSISNYLSTDEQDIVNKVKNAVIALNILNKDYEEIKLSISNQKSKESD